MADRKLALISVSDRTGLVEFCANLVELGFDLLTTGGTGAALKEAGLPIIPIEEYTGQEEILDGRVKTLHPKIHGGILADMRKESHLTDLECNRTRPIHMVVVNLYPFVKGLDSDKSKDPEQMVGLIDIGGPTMIRAAAKNFASVVPVIDPSDYGSIVEELRSQGAITLKSRLELSVKVFKILADYNLQIARYFSEVSVTTDTLEIGDLSGPSVIDGRVLERGQELRYGENPHQTAGFYRSVGDTGKCWKQLQGKELSYNNMLDMDAGIRLMRDFRGGLPSIAILKHLNPCGFASDSDLLVALKMAKQGDPRSHFGGIIVASAEVGEQVAENIGEDFAEIVVAPKFSDSALGLLSKKKNLRLIEVDLDRIPDKFEIRSVVDGFLMQSTDGVDDASAKFDCVAGQEVDDAKMRDLMIAWKICAHTKSNAICLANNSMLVSSGAGQMSRVDAVELAIHKAKIHGHSLQGSVAASDAFFPFPDGLELLIDAGVVAVVAPGGAMRDNEIIELARVKNISLYFANERHFRH